MYQREELLSDAIDLNLVKITLISEYLVQRHMKFKGFIVTILWFLASFILGAQIYLFLF